MKILIEEYGEAIVTVAIVAPIIAIFGELLRAVSSF